MRDHVDDHDVEHRALLAQLEDLAKKIFLQNSRCLLALFNNEESRRLTILQGKFAQIEADARALGLDDLVDQRYASDFAVLRPSPPARKISNPALDLFLATGLNLTPRRVEKKPALSRARMYLEDWP
jgi:hypothetical protein